MLLPAHLLHCMPKTILIATLGGQPQVVTFGLDILLARGESISDVYLIHPSSEQPRLRQALSKLLDTFAGDHYQGHPCRLHRIPLRGNGAEFTDIHSDAQAAVAWEQIRGFIAEQKNAGHKLHLLVAGGRRLMGLLVSSAAALLCDHSDQLWHIYTPDAVQQRVRNGARMHVTPEEGVVLIRVPLVPWGSYFPGLRAMALAPQETVARQMAWQQQDHAPCQAVYDRLSARQRDALRAFAAGGSPQAVAEQLQISLSTVSTYKTAILAECRIAWQLPEDERLTYHFIAQHFGPFLQQLDQA